MGKIEQGNFNCSIKGIKDIGLDKITCDLKIGLFRTNVGYITIAVLSSLGLYSNAFMIINFFYRLAKSKERSTKNTMKKLFVLLQGIDCIQSIYWIISSLVFQSADDIKSDKTGCTILSVIYIFIINFEFFLMNCLLSNFRRISSNPIDGIFKPFKNMFKYIFLSSGFGITLGLFSYFSGAIGRSPFVTCYLNTEQHFYENLFILGFPILLILLIIYQIIFDLCKNKLFNSDKEVRKLYIQNSFCVLASCLLYLPMIILMLLSLFKYSNTDKSKYYFKEINNFVTILTSSIPLIVNNCKIIFGFSELKCCKKIIEKNPYKKYQITKSFKNTLNKTLTNNLSTKDQFSWLESHSIEYFIRDIFVGISTALKKSTEKYGKTSQILPSYTHQSTQYTIHFGNLCLDDDTVKNSDYLDIKIEEFAPRCFSYLRNLENIDMNEMINQFLPKNNKKGIKQSQGKSGSFFISTDDSKYLIKTLKVEEFDLIKNCFLYKYCKYLSENPKSLLARLYGMYNLTVNQGKDNILIIVMRNVIGDFQDNILAKFDLKGSSFKRESNFDMDKVDEKTMKDNNFDEIEHKIFLAKESKEKLRTICKKDSEFLRDMELMDYSLFLVKISLPKEEAKDIFGDNIIDDQNVAMNQILFEEKLDNSANIDNSKDDMKRNFSVKGEGQTHDIKYYKSYLYPSIKQGTAYILAIIDYLQIFNFFKYLESELKTKFRKNGKKIISCIDPKAYSDRFINYIIDITDLGKILNVENEMNTNDSKIIDNTENEGDISLQAGDLQSKSELFGKN